MKENNFDLNIIDEKIKNLKFEKKEEKIEKIEFDHLEARFIPKEINTFDDYIHIYMKPRKINTTSPICLICVVGCFRFNVSKLLSKYRKYGNNVCFTFIFNKTFT